MLRLSWLLLLLLLLTHLLVLLLTLLLMPVEHLSTRCKITCRGIPLPPVAICACASMLLPHTGSVDLLLVKSIGPFVLCTR